MALTMRVVPCELFEELMKMMTRRDEPRVIEETDKVPVNDEMNEKMEIEDVVMENVPVPEIVKSEAIEEAETPSNYGDTENTFQNWKTVSDVSTQTESPLQKAGRRKKNTRKVNRKVGKKVSNKKPRKR